MADMSDDSVIQYTDSNFKIYEFTKSAFGTEILYSIIKMEQSVFIWVGYEGNKQLSDLSLAVQSKFGKLPLATHLFGNSSDVISKSLTVKLSKKLGKPVYLSYNVPDNQMVTAVVKNLMTEIENNSDKF